LQEVANILYGEIKNINAVLSRYGGEEFLIIMEHSGYNDANELANRIVAIFNSVEIPHVQNSNGEFLTVSVGLSTSLIKECNQERMLQEADEALYYIKEHGKNNFTSYLSITKVV
ncbi:MAG: GGDEF domain-containing protein, partial [Bacilli bacterium]